MGSAWKRTYGASLQQTTQGYILSDIVPLIFDGDNIDEDLKILRAEPATKADVALLNAFLDEISSCENATWQLLKWSGSHDSSPYFNCKAIACFHEAGFNLYRIRPLRSRLQKYRIIYAFDAYDSSIHLLAVTVAVKDAAPPPPLELHYDYSPSHPISVRIRDEYERTAITKL